MDKALSAEELSAQFNQLAPWTTKFTINGASYGGYYDAFSDVRLSVFQKMAGQSSTVLELGCLEGGHTIPLASLPGVRFVCGVDVRPSNLEKARLVSRLFGKEGVTRFILKNVEIDQLADMGPFDVAFCVSIMHFLRKPWLLLQKLRPIVGAIFLESYYVDSFDHTEEGFQGRLGRISISPSIPEGPVISETFLPTQSSLQQMFWSAGFSIEKAFYEPRPGKDAVAKIYAIADHSSV